MEKQLYCKSPMNYIGNKYKLLHNIIPLFPSHINTFYDVFAGGLDVSINIKAESIYCNDINNFLIDIYQEFQKMDINSLLTEIDGIINKYELSMTNKEGYLKLREEYNKTKNIIDLYVLVCYSFNYQFRFNSKHEYNNPFGKDRSSFNSKIRNNLITFHNKITNFNFLSLDFRDLNLLSLSSDDFVYLDPPYLITTGSYNDGKRGFKGWNSTDDLDLFNLLDSLNSKDIKFALSNVLEHKGIKNEPLIAWSLRYNIHNIEHSYKNSNYQRKNKESVTKEVLITNY